MEAEVAGCFLCYWTSWLVLYLWLIMKYWEIKYHTAFMCMHYHLTAVSFTLSLRQ